MPTVVFPYTKAGRAAARKAAKLHGGEVVQDKKPHKGIDIMIAVGSKPATKKSPAKKRKRSKKA